MGGCEGIVDPRVRPANLGKVLCASGRRVLGTHLTAKAYQAALEKVNIARSFVSRGCVWPTEDGSHINLRELPAYRYDPTAPLLRLLLPKPPQPRAALPSFRMEEIL